MSNARHARAVKNAAEGLRQGLRDYFDLEPLHFPRIAIVYRPSRGATRVHDPQGLLAEPRFVALLRDDDSAIPTVHTAANSRRVVEQQFGGTARVFAEVPDRCFHVGPVQQWAYFAASVLDGTLSSARTTGRTTSEHRPLRSYAREAICAEFAAHIGATAGHPVDHESLQAYSHLVQRLSIQREEGRPPTGWLAYIDESAIGTSEVRTRLTLSGDPFPNVANTKHVCKLLAGGQSRWPLVVAGASIVGYGDSDVLRVAGAVSVHFRKRLGLVYTGEEPVAVVRDGAFHGCGWDARSVPSALAEILGEQGPSIEAIAQIALNAAENGHGATVLVDASGDARRRLAGHRATAPLDLRAGGRANLDLAASLGNVDGALVVSTDGRMHGFGFLLDGDSMKTEDLARGARYNTALRYSKTHPHDVLLVVSSDGPVKIFLDGQVVFPPCDDVPMVEGPDPTLKEWLRQHDAYQGPRRRRQRAGAARSHTKRRRRTSP